MERGVRKADAYYMKAMGKLDFSTTQMIPLRLTKLSNPSAIRVPPSLNNEATGRLDNALKELDYTE